MSLKSLHNSIYYSNFYKSVLYKCDACAVPMIKASLNLWSSVSSAIQFLFLDLTCLIVEIKMLVAHRHDCVSKQASSAF